jgi:nucleoside-diphosphate-sugar epimerase
VQQGYPAGTFYANDLYPLRAAGAYSLSKLLQEELTRNFHEQYGMSIAVIRPWGIIDADAMVTTDGRPVTDIGWGTIDRRDVAGALVSALETPDIAYECFHVTATPGGYQTTDAGQSEQRLGWRAQRRFDAGV